ncbi:MAG TPA: aldehyde ferredoxin oxidoreductase C-terminal domain-containing protein [Planctomycetota bacterium]|nr:aldehyde ferredoxin oxidoreductase C-terminal domain-containing protein [Planctomycetota bacterium]
MVAEGAGGKTIADFSVRRFHVDLGTGEAREETVRCEDLEDVLGGIARAYKVLAGRRVKDAYDPAATLILNLGVLSGTAFMTGLRTFFHAYSPLKCSIDGMPAPMWTAGSCKFGTKLKYMGVEEVLFTGRAAKPSILRISPGPKFELLDAGDIRGLLVNDKVQALYKRYPEAHFAVLGPAGENYEHVRYAAIALSTENQLRSGDPKSRFCGRGGIGGVLGSKNVIAIVADTPDQREGAAPPPASFKDLNQEVARGPGSRRFRDKKRADGGGGTWANYEALNPVHAMPEMNFAPTGTTKSAGLHRAEVEKGPYVVVDEACYRCGIRCHKNVYDKGADGKPAKFRAKLDFEPLNLLASNIGIFDIDPACELVELVDQYGMDSISLGVTLSYVMEYNRRHPDKPIAGGLSYGDPHAAHHAIEDIGRGKMPDLGQGSARLSRQLGETGYAMHCKGMEFAAYLPHTNPGYPFALAGGHMSMRTYLLVLYEKETGMDYWVDAITRRGLSILRDDVLGVCKFAGLDDDKMAKAVTDLIGMTVTGDDLKRIIRRSYLRGYALERAQGFREADYDMPAEVHNRIEPMQLPYFNTPEFFAELKGKVLRRFDEMLVEEKISV